MKKTHEEKLAEAFSPLTKKLSEIIYYAEKLRDVYNKGDFEKENQEIVPVESQTGEIIEDIQCNIRALPNSSNYPQIMRETLSFL